MAGSNPSLVDSKIMTLQKGYEFGSFKISQELYLLGGIFRMPAAQCYMYREKMLASPNFDIVYDCLFCVYEFSTKFRITVQCIFYNMSLLSQSMAKWL